jgi:hypothetical protein
LRAPVTSAAGGVVVCSPRISLNTSVTDAPVEAVVTSAWNTQVPDPGQNWIEEPGE